MTQQIPRSTQAPKPRDKRPSTLWGEFKDDPGLIAYFNNDYTKHLIKMLDQAKSRLEINDDYGCPSWAYKQADINGRLAIIKLVKDLLLHDQ